MSAPKGNPPPGAIGPADSSKHRFIRNGWAYPTLEAWEAAGRRAAVEPAKPAPPAAGVKATQGK